MIKKGRHRVSSLIGKQIDEHDCRGVLWRRIGDYQVARLSKDFLFIEGFLLYSDTFADDAAPALHPEDLHSLIQLLHDNNVDAKDWDLILAKQDTHRKQWPLNREARKALMQRFDSRLFLPTTRNEARERRMNRATYVDSAILGGLRTPGQMWKTQASGLMGDGGRTLTLAQGYFEDIVWGSWVKDHGWLGSAEDDIGNTVVGLDEDVAAQHGIRVRPMDQGSIEKTVWWGLDCILQDFFREASL